MHLIEYNTILTTSTLEAYKLRLIQSYDTNNKAKLLDRGRSDSEDTVIVTKTLPI